MPEVPIADTFGLIGTALEGRFLVERVVAEGGFGVVYHARQTALDRPIALKVLKTPKHFDEAEEKQFLAGFAAEAKTVARITHPSIVQVFDFGVSDMPSGGRAAWMALEWLTGVTLEEDLLARRGKGGRSPSECLALMKPVLTALALVHNQGVAHRDIKPGNIMIVPSPVGPTPRLLDFGIAKMMDADEGPGSGHTRTRSNQVAFSPGYAAPEQISQGRSGPWTDVHAMGLVLSEMLIDAPPIEGTEMAVLFQQIVDRVRPTPAKMGVQVGAWEPVLLRALAVSSAERFRDAGELLAALESTVAAAEASYARAGERAELGAASPRLARKEDTLAAMSTQMVPPSAVSGPLASSPRPNNTTHSPVSQDEKPAIRSGVAAWVVGGIAVAAAAGVLAYRSLAHAPVTETPAIAAAASVIASSEPTPAPSASPSASAPPAAPAPSAPRPSATPTASAPPAPAPSPPARSTPPRRPPPATPSPTPSKGIVIE